MRSLTTVVFLISTSIVLVLGLGSPFVSCNPQKTADEGRAANALQKDQHEDSETAFQSGPERKNRDQKFTPADLDLLKERSSWQKASEAKQDGVIKHIEKKLGKAYRWLETKSYTCNGESARIATFVHIKSGLHLNLIPGGHYSMGSKNGEDSEKPVHKVKIKPFLIGRSEVRQLFWDKIGGSDERSNKGPLLPIEMVSWIEAQKWLKKAAGKLRLPSESEWEYACRSSATAAGTTTAYSWGKKIDDSYCWYATNCDNKGKKTRDVTAHLKTKKLNSFGLADMSGNVWEWCQDHWIDNYSKGPKDSAPRTNTGSEHVTRGGAWGSEGEYLRSAHRSSDSKDTQATDLGFRVARSLILP
jgi:formylglycine-generating enzyme required for sulfatase activity